MEKCLHVLPMNKLSGAEKVALLACKNLKEYYPIVVCGGNELKKVFDRNSIKCYKVNFSDRKLLSRLITLKKIIKKNNIKIIHAHDNIASLNCYLVKQIFRLDIKVISHIHNCYPWLKKKSINKKIDEIFRKKYDYNIVCGELVYNFYKKNSKYFNTKKAMILSNAMDINEIVNSTEDSNIKQLYNIPKNKTILGFIGRLSEQKGIIPFIKSFEKYKHNFKDSIILLVGNGEQENEIKLLINELGLKKYFLLLGFQDDIYKFYPMIDVFFLPSLYEGLPMAILEAAAFKKPIISMDVGSISELIDDEENGILVKKNNYEMFIKKLIALKNNISIREKYSENIFEKLRKNYDIDIYVKKLEEIYKEI